MARFGTGINASLGAVDYRPYMQGAMAGSQAIAQGIAALGQAAGGAIQTYYAKKEEEKKKEDAANSFIATVEANPAAFQGYLKDGKVDKEAIKTMVNTIGVPGTLQLNAYLADAAKQQKADKTKTDAAKYATQLEQGGGNLPFPYRKGAETTMYSPEAIQGGRQAYTSQKQAEATLEETLAKAQALRAPKAENKTEVEGYYEKQKAAFVSQNGRQPNATEDAQIFQQAIEAKKPQTTNNFGPRASAEAIGSVAKSLEPDRQMLQKSVRLVPDLQVMEGLLNAGVIKNGAEIITGPLASIELTTKALLNKVGLTNFEDVAPTQRYLQKAYLRLAEVVAQFGAGTGISDRDLETAKTIVGGNLLNVTPEQLRSMIDEYKRVVAYQSDFYSSEVQNRLPKQTDPELEAVANTYRQSLAINPEYYQYFKTPSPWSTPSIKREPKQLPSGEYRVNSQGRMVP